MIKTKNKFFKELEKNCNKYFSKVESEEIIDDYHMFFEEKELNNLSLDKIIEELGEPKDIIHELVKDKSKHINVITRLLSLEKLKWLIIAVWLSLNLLLVFMLEWTYVAPMTGSILVICQIGLYLYLFVYEGFLLNQSGNVSKGIFWKLNIFALITIVLSYFNLMLLKSFSADLSSTYLAKMLPSNIGPLVHYQILFNLIVSLIFLYIVLYRCSNVIIAINSLFFFVSSVILMIGLHAQLANLSSMPAFNYYISNQMLVYGIIIVVFVMVQFVTYNKYKEVLK